MITITFNPIGTTVAVPAHSPLTEAAKKADISVELPCGGKGVCGKCLVKIESGTVDYDNNGQLPQALLDQSMVLICRTKATNTDITLTVLSDIQNESGKFTDAEEDYAKLPQSLIPKPSEIDFTIKLFQVSVKEPKAGDGLSDLDRLTNAIKEHLPEKSINIPLEIIQQLPSTLRTDKNLTATVTVIYHETDNGIAITAIKSGAQNNVYAVAIDIGTTTIAAAVTDKSGKMLTAANTYNTQIECGLDVISRINYAQKAERLQELQDKVTASINALINELTTALNITPHDIQTASIAANTTMVHLLLGISPEYIRLDPYTPAIYTVPTLTAKELKLNINPNAPIDIAPSVGSYVGGDITAGLLCTELSQQTDKISLFIDIGTNGELVLGGGDFLIACACSAGPAFEGGGISCGMRASKGAIERVEIDALTLQPSCATVANAAPKGICGSGMISLLAQLLKHNIIDAAGKLNRKAPNVFANGKNAYYKLTANGADEICVSESDISNIIRAKAAIFSACRTMLSSVETTFSDLDCIYIAGGFGRYLDIENAKSIGLLPNLPKEKLIFLGNTSLMGAYIALTSKYHRKKRDETAKTITYIDLSTEPTYMDEYTAALFIPHTDADLFK